LTKLVSPFEETEYNEKSADLLLEIQKIINAVRDIKLGVKYHGLKRYEDEFKDKLGDTTDFIKSAEYFQFILAAYAIDKAVDFDHVISWDEGGVIQEIDSFMRFNSILCDNMRLIEIMRFDKNSPTSFSVLSHDLHVTQCDHEISKPQLSFIQKKIIQSILNLPKIESQRMALFISRIEDLVKRGVTHMTQTEFLREVIRNRDSNYYKPIITALIEAGYIRKIVLKRIIYVLDLRAKICYNCSHWEECSKAHWEAIKAGEWDINQAKECDSFELEKA
jgi:hypothetical protein